MTKLLSCAAVVSLALGAPVSAAPPCKDAKGKFIKCPPAKPVAAARCKLNGKFAKCGTPGAKPV